MDGLFPFQQGSGAELREITCPWGKVSVPFFSRCLAWSLRYTVIFFSPGITNSEYCKSHCETVLFKPQILGVVGLRYNLSSVDLFISCTLLALAVVKPMKTAIPFPKVQRMETKRTRDVAHATLLCFMPLRRAKGLGLACTSHHKGLRER